MIVGGPMQKQSGEIWDWSVRFASELAAGQTLATAVFRAVREVDSQDVTADLKQTDPAIIEPERSTVAQMVKAGVSGESYMLELKVTDNVGRIFEAERRLIVKDIP